MLKIVPWSITFWSFSHLCPTKFAREEKSSFEEVIVCVAAENIICEKFRLFVVTVPSSVKNQPIRNGILRHHNFSRHIFSGKTQKVLCGLTLSVVWSNTVCPFSQLTFCVLSMMLYKNVSSFVRVFTILPYQARARRTKARGSASTRECSGWSLFCQLNLRYCLATFVTKLTNPWIHRKTGFRETKWLLPSDCRKDVFFNWVSYRSNSSPSFWSLFAEGESVKVRLHARFLSHFFNATFVAFKVQF